MVITTFEFFSKEHFMIANEPDTGLIFGGHNLTFDFFDIVFFLCCHSTITCCIDSITIFIYWGNPF